MSTLSSLQYSSMPRTASLGMDYLALLDDDAAVGFDNPSLLRGCMAHTGVLSVMPLVGGSMMGTIGYVHPVKEHGTLAVAFNFTSYGSFRRIDEEDHEHGTFSAGDYGLQVSYGTWLNEHFSVGATMKPILSQYESYTAVAVAFDVAGSYVGADSLLVATAMLHNIGAQLSTFDDKSERLPFELEAEVSYKLRRAPFRLFMAATELQRWNLRYEDPLNPTTTYDPYTGQTTRQSPFVGTLDNLLRHVQVGVEVTLGRSFYARMGYNYRQGAEMRGFDALSLSAFSFGIGLKLRHFEFSYAHRNYHLSQGSNGFALMYRF